MTDQNRKENMEFQMEFDAAFRKHRQHVYRTAFCITRNETDAKDVLQNVFMRLIRLAIPLPAPEEAKSYLCRAAVNEALNLLRSQDSQKLEDVDLESIELPDPESPDLVSGIDREKKLQRIHSVIAGMKSDYYQLLMLHFVDGWTHKEIGKMLGMRRATVSIQLWRAKHELKKRVRQEEVLREIQKEHPTDSGTLLAD